MKDELGTLDQMIEEKFQSDKPWGISTQVDLFKCDPKLIRSKEHISKFVVDLCDFLEVERFGDPQVVHFGEDPRVSGYSMTQLIETSLVSAHFVEEKNDVYIDIFSCKFYPPQAASDFCEHYFKADVGRFRYNFRG